MQPGLAKVLLGVAAAACLVVPAHAAETKLEDPSGVLRIDASGRWRPHESEFGISATGFLGIKRAELFAQVYEEVKDAGAATTRWKKWREEQGGDPKFAHEGGEALRFTAHSAGRGTVDYVRALAGAGKTAVIWVRLSGAPGVAADDAAALLDAVVLAVPEPEGGGEEPTGAGEKPDGAKAGSVFKDQDFRIQVTLPPGWAARKSVQPDSRRVLSLRGTVGTDEEAYFDLYAFDSFVRADAVGHWWREAERRGWDAAVRVVGEPTSFKVEVQGETWTRHVRVVHTKAGLYGFKLDVNSQVEKTATALIDQVIAGGIEVLKERMTTPAVPAGMKQVAGETVTMFHAGEVGPAQAVLAEVQEVDTLIQGMLGLEPWEGRRLFVFVHADAPTLQAALRPHGAEDEDAARWLPSSGIVVTRAGIIGDDDLRARLREEVARAALHLRMGYRVPYWLERGLSLALAGGAYHRGRTDLPHPKLLDDARNAAGGSIEFEAARWWTEAASAGNPERDAILWSFGLLFTHGGPLAKKWQESFARYVALLHSAGDPVAANAAFDFARESEFIDDWKKWVRKL